MPLGLGYFKNSYYYGISIVLPIVFINKHSFFMNKYALNYILCNSSPHLFLFIEIIFGLFCIIILVQGGELVV